MSESYIPIICGKEAAKVKVSDILMIERENRKLHVITQDKAYAYYEKIQNVEPMLDGRFYPCLKGCYINLDHVTGMANQTITFDNGTEYNLGKENFIKAKQTYVVYLKKIY
ncbi:DNA-binding LytR/AlgR family response regulator [Clostridiales Family XIII bacterium PM5-7]